MSQVPKTTFPPLADGTHHPTGEKARICIATPEVIGPYKCGGIGTLYTTLAYSLAAAGHDVTLLYLRGDYCEKGTMSEWVDAYRAEGVTLAPLETSDERVHGALGAVTSYHAYAWLKRQDFDIVHFPELAGPGLYAMLAKRHGLCFSRTLFVVGTHGPTLWVREANHEPLHELYDLENDFAERQSVALADVVWSPSRYLLGWMRGREWDLHDRCYVQPYILPQAARSTTASDASLQAGSPIEELVFFGRLETRKGLELFCDALDELSKTGPSTLSVTFLGRNWKVGQEDSDTYIGNRAERWPWKWKIASDWNQPEAIAYLKSGSKLAVMPSFMDNSPNTVYECLGGRIPFIAGRSGGIPELIHEDDEDAVCFPLEPQALAAKMLAAIQNGVRVARPAVAFEENERRWTEWHERLVVQAPEAPTRPSVQVIKVHSDEGTDGAIAAAWNRAAKDASGDYLLFAERTHDLRADAADVLARAAARSGADILSAFKEHLASDGTDENDRRVVATEIPLGGALAVGAFYNCFGTAPICIKREALTALGGFSAGARGARDLAWGLCARARSLGLLVEVVPESLFSQRAPGAEDAPTDSYPDQLAATRALSDALPAGWHGLGAIGPALRSRRDVSAASASAKKRSPHPTQTLLAAARLLADHGAPVEALRLLAHTEASIDTTERDGDRVQVALVTAYTHLRGGDNASAKEVALGAVELSAKLGQPQIRFEAALRAAELTSLIGDHDVARQLFLASFRHARGLRKPQAMIEALTSAGQAHITMNEPDMAKQLWQTAHKLAEQSAFPVASQRARELLDSLEPGLPSPRAS